MTEPNRIREEQQNQLHRAENVLDVFHALEHFTQVGKALSPGDNAAAIGCLPQARDGLLQQGRSAQRPICSNGLVECAAAVRHPRLAVRPGMASHQHHPNDTQRLQLDRSIGSGQVEGVCKTLSAAAQNETKGDPTAFTAWPAFAL